jgi:hypothetical protein
MDEGPKMGISINNSHPSQHFSQRNYIAFTSRTSILEKKSKFLLKAN